MRRALTLVELLIVIAVIAVLGAILLPVFAKARERARCTQCVSNLRQIHSAVGVYLADWDDKYPWAWRNTGHPKPLALIEHPVLREVVTAYAKEDGIWACPSDIGETFPEGPSGYRTRTPPFYTFGLSSYDYIGRGFASSWSLAGKGAGSIRKPSHRVLSVENRPWHGGYRPDDDYAASPGLVNVLYCDGHCTRKTAKGWDGEQKEAVRPD